MANTVLDEARINVRCTTAERATWLAIARAQDLTLSQLIRRHLSELAKVAESGATERRSGRGKKK